MFKFQLLMGIFCLKGLYGAQTINLTELDSTWVVSGYQTKLLSPITILSGAYYSVQFMVKFENGTKQTDTDFVITDSSNTTIDSKTLNSTKMQAFLGTITIVDKSPVSSYSLSFRLVNWTDSTSSLLFYGSRIFTIVPNDGYLHTYSNPSSGNYGAFAIFTAMPSLYASPTISLRPTNQVKAGCEHLVYQGGYPAAAGANRYLIHTFNSANTGPASSLSFIPSYSATISVPPNCPISIDAADYSKDYSGKHGVLMNVVPRNGFVMSRDYPNSMIGSGNGGMNVNLQYALNSSVFANQSVYFNILVDQFFDGQAGTPQLKLSFDNQVGYILNKTTTGFSQNRNASSFRVEFTTSNTTGANFLLHFSTSTTSTTDSPTRTTTRTTKSIQNVSFLFVFVLALFHCCLKA